MADAQQDPLSTLKLMAATYGVPPEIVDRFFNAAFDLIEGTVSERRAAEIAHLAQAALAMAQLGQKDMAEALMVEVREIMELSSPEPVSDTTPGEGPQA